MSTENRIKKEFEDITNNPLTNHSIKIKDNNLYKWEALIKGPEDSPYKDGFFILEINFPDDYPFCPPKINFITKIYHCNINSSGGICLDILKDNWSPALTIDKILLSITSLLNDPNPTDPLVAEIGELLRSNKKEHDEKAAMYTKLYAINNYNN